MKNSDTILQERLRQDDKKVLAEVYSQHKEAFLNYGVRYNLDRAELMDIYQDSVVAMYQNFVEKQTVLEKSNIKTYLFGIAKNQIFTALKAKSRLYALPDEPEEVEVVELDTEIVTEEQQLFAKYFRQIGESCQELLKMYYYRGLTIKEMVEYSNYKDENTVKSYKSRCLKKLRALIATSPN